MIFLKIYFRRTSVGAHNIIESIIDTNACEGTANEVNYIEQVEIVVTIKASVRGALEIFLTSPSDTRSLILPVTNSNILNFQKKFVFSF